MHLKCFQIILLCIGLSEASKRRKSLHNEKSEGSSPHYPAVEETQEYWKEEAQNKLFEEVNHVNNNNQAKNIIFFLGDGMGISTLTAARIHKGVLAGLEGGEQATLSFEQFPHVALSKTYCVDSIVADSACSATAYLGGVKGNRATIGLSAAGRYKDCETQLNPNNQVSTIMDWAQAAGKATGVVSTNGITDASPAGAYAKVAYRGWYNDWEVADDGADPAVCDDIAEQLVRRSPGNNLTVIMAGGRGDFFDQTVPDAEGEDDGVGYRTDGADLVQEWIQGRKNRGATYKYTHSGQEMKDFTDYDVDFFMGLFAIEDMEYNLEQTPEMDDPTLAEMTEKTLQILSTKNNGFVVFIEAGLVDHGHHGNKAREALDETLQLDAAVTKALELVNLDETLIIVTADHSHAMTINGYPDRGEGVFDLAGHGSDGLYYSTIMYGTGPGYKDPETDGSRYDITQDDMTYEQYRFMAAAPESSSDHAGEDVAIYAVGPQAHLFRGIYQQNYIPHLLAYAACIGDGAHMCDVKQ